MSLWLFLAVLLFVACAVLLVIEIFVPSFGLLTLFALGCLVGGGMIFFDQGTVAGWTGMGIAALLIPTVWIVTYKAFPQTSLGKSIILGKVSRDRGDAIPDTDKLKSLLGAEGVVLSPLRPVGMCDFSGDRVECVAETGYIDTDNKIRVIKVEGTQLTVRKIQET